MTIFWPHLFFGLYSSLSYSGFQGKNPLILFIVSRKLPQMIPPPKKNAAWSAKSGLFRTTITPVSIIAVHPLASRRGKVSGEVKIIFRIKNLLMRKGTRRMLAVVQRWASFAPYASLLRQWPYQAATRLPQGMQPFAPAFFLGRCHLLPALRTMRPSGISVWKRPDGAGWYQTARPGTGHKKNQEKICYVDAVNVLSFL